MEVVLDAIGDDGVSGVVTAVEAAHDVGLHSKQVDDFSLAFVAPLRSKYDSYN